MLCGKFPDVPTNPKYLSLREYNIIIIIIIIILVVAENNLLMSHSNLFNVY